MAKKQTLPKLKKKLQEIFNKYIRLRDEGRTCISCGKFNKLQAGHYYPVSKYDGIRFDEDNVNGECAGCNCFDEGHLIHYRENLISKIGKKRFEELKERADDYKRNGYKFTRFELEERIEYYKQKTKEL